MVLCMIQIQYLQKFIAGYIVKDTTHCESLTFLLGRYWNIITFITIATHVHLH